MNKDELVQLYVQKTKAIDELAKQAYLSNLFAFNQDILHVEDGGEGTGKRVPLKPFHEELCKFIQNNPQRKKIALMPRGHLKTTLVTVGYTLQRIAKDPKVRILLANATGTMAEAMLSQIKKHLQYNDTFKYYFGDLYTGASSWRDNMITLPTGEGSYQSKEATVTAYGLGGSLVSQHYDVIIVDDAHNRENINTKDQIEKVKQSYRDLLDLLEPGGQLIIIGCMVGETKVTMADGSEKNLRDIKVGDKIKTYDNGKLSTSVIKNWANQGRDLVFTITTSSGKIFKANERHPFLIYKNKKLQWIRVKNLHTGYKIVTLKDNGVNGKGKSVSGKDVTNQLPVGGIVQNTTIKKDGLMDITHPVLILGHFVTHISNIATGLRLKIMNLLSKNKIINVPFVESQPVGGGQIKNTSVLTTTTKREKLGDCSAMTVIWQLVTQKTRKMLSPSWSTSDFILDEIVSIKKDGEEEVFDIEVDRTGNFIANGVVSSNTKWHDDDLYGQVMDKSNPEAGEFDVFIRQAITEMKLGHSADGHFVIEAGNVLWPEKYSLKALTALLNEKGLYEFSCTPAETPILMADWSEKKISDIEVGDTVIGWSLGSRHCKSKLKPSKVVAFGTRKCAVVKVTMESGRTVRCTADHHWYLPPQGVGKTKYLPAKVGRKMTFMGRLLESRTDNWLGGIFDGEGSGDGKVFRIAQSRSHNPEVCQEIERRLNLYGFKWGYNYAAGVYWINGGILEKARFLRISNPIRKEKIAQSLWTADFIHEKDVVVKIEDDGVEDVFSMQTETGNYIAWGYCSRNCQYQNLAVDDENAVFHKAWFHEYDVTDIRDRKMTRFTAIDPAISLKERADFTAIVTIGIDVLGKIYVLEVKRGHYTEDQMVEELFLTYERYHPINICIETVAFQKTLQHYIMKEIKRRGRSLPLNEVLPESDESKEKRIRLLQPMYMRSDIFHSKSVPNIEYLEDELLRFPKGKNDDVADAMAYAVRASFPPRQKEKEGKNKSYLY